MRTLTLTLIALAFLSVPSFAQKGAMSQSDTVKTASTLKYIITQHGKGPKLHEGNVVIAHYVGRFLDGKVFDSSRERQEPFAFTLGRHQVIKGWDEGFSYLRVGDQATIIVPSRMGYDTVERGPIPANSVLIFDVEVVDMKEHGLSDFLSETIEAKGIDSALKIYQALKKKGFPGYYVSEAQINMLGYKLMNELKTREAVEILKINSELYPESSNVYDSLGEACMNNGDRENAITNYKKSLELNPKNDNATEMLKKLELK